MVASMRQRRLVVATPKGGVGKSCTAANLAALAAARGHRTLLVDLDPQGSVANALRLEATGNIGDVLLDEGCQIADIVLSARSNLDVAPATRQLERAAVLLPTRFDQPWQRFLAAALDETEQHYDYVVIDTAPSMGPLTIAALVAASQVLVPTQLEMASAQQVGELLNIVEGIRAPTRGEALNPSLKVVGVLPTFVDLRSRLAVAILAELKRSLSVPVLEPGVKNLVVVREATYYGQTLNEYAPSSQPAMAYATLADQLLRGVARGGTRSAA